MVIDFRRSGNGCILLTVNSSSVERDSCYKHLQAHIATDLNFSYQEIPTMPPLPVETDKSAFASIMITFYSWTIQSFLTHSITVWFGNYMVTNCKSLQRIARAA